MMQTIAHISDLHFGRVIEKVADGLIEALYRIDPDLVVISGDLTQRGRSSQFIQARAYLERIPFPCIIVPGNHDVCLYNLVRRFAWPLERYKQYITSELSPFFTQPGLAVLGINTSRSLTWKNGRISAEQADRVRDRFARLPARTFKVLVTHHPFLPPPDHQNMPLVGRAKRMLARMGEYGPDMLLAGHFHMSYAGGSHSVYPSLHHSVLVIQAGTATSSRMRRENNAFNLIRVQDQAVELDVRMWDGRAFVRHHRQCYRKNRAGEWTAKAAPLRQKEAG